MLKLRPYQEEAKRRALAHEGFALFLEQRTGKTPTACEVIQARAPQRLLIACPKIAIDVWAAHLHETDLPNTELRILNFESLWRQRRRLKRWAPDFVLVDESHRIKDRTSKQSRAIRSISTVARYRLALTGTPLEGKIEDAWAQFDFIDPRIFGPWNSKLDEDGNVLVEGFKDRYLIYGGFRKKKVVGTRNLEEFQRKFESRYYRELLEDVKETPTNISSNVIRFDLVASAREYQRMEGTFIAELSKFVMVKKIAPDGTASFVRQRARVVAPRVITQAMKLHQLSGGFILDEERVVHRFGDEKLEQLGVLLLSLSAPAVVFVRFLPELYRIAALCRALGRSVTLISGKHKFTKFDTDVAVVQIRSGVAIDLARAEEAIFYSWTYSYLDYDQAKFRIRSYTSDRARYWYLIAKGTIDEVLYEAVTSKLSFSKLIVDKYRRD